MRLSVGDYVPDVRHVCKRCARIPENINALAGAISDVRRLSDSAEVYCNQQCQYERKKNLLFSLLFAPTHTCATHSARSQFFFSLPPTVRVCVRVSSPCLDLRISTLLLVFSNKTEYSHSHHDVLTYLMGIRCAWKVEKCLRALCATREKCLT